MAHQLYLKENLIITSNKSMRGITDGLLLCKNLNLDLVEIDLNAK